MTTYERIKREQARIEARAARRASRAARGRPRGMKLNALWIAGGVLFLFSCAVLAWVGYAVSINLL